MDGWLGGLYARSVVPPRVFPYISFSEEGKQGFKVRCLCKSPQKDHRVVVVLRADILLGYASLIKTSGRGKQQRAAAFGLKEAAQILEIESMVVRAAVSWSPCR